MGKHTQHARIWGAFLFLLGCLAATLKTGSVFAAPHNQPPGPDRYTAVTVRYTAYEWWLTRWADNQVVCTITVEHEGQPAPGEIYIDCGTTLYEEWLEQLPCPAETLRDDPSACPGYYLHFVSSMPAQRDVPVALPPPVVWITLEGYRPKATTNRCASAPRLILTGDEPLSGEHITRIEGEMDGKPFTCGAQCRLPLSITGEAGIDVAFWAYSSYGDSSKVFDARVRVVQTEGSSPDEPLWYADVLSPQWRGQPAAGCAESWDVFPPVGGPPGWLSTPGDIAALTSNFSYSYLAGNLITQGFVDASECPGNGLFPGRDRANNCGLEAARPMVNEWQNRFDALIMDIAQETSVPAHLLKNLFARESQFWPGISPDGSDVGLGQLTSDGADTVFLWNPIFFEQFCPLALADAACRKGYLHLQDEQRELLREALVYSVNATCENCPFGLDISQAEFSVSVFAHTLLANCEQAGHIVHNVTNDSPGAVSTYEDLWKFTLVNYNAGSGCLSLAVEDAYAAGETLDWESVSSYLTPVCEGARDYVNDISR